MKYSGVLISRVEGGSVTYVPEDVKPRECLVFLCVGCMGCVVCVGVCAHGGVCGVV